MDSEIPECRKCKKIISISAKQIECGGVCYGKFHIECCNLTCNEALLIKSSENINWQCDLCLVVKSKIFQNEVENIVYNKINNFLDYNQGQLSQFDSRLSKVEKLLFNKSPKEASLSGNEQPYSFIFNKKALIGTGVIVLLTVLIGIIILIYTNSLQTQTNGLENVDDIEPTNGTLTILTKRDWGGMPSRKTLDRLNLPVHRVIISHTASDICRDKETCSSRCQRIQDFHMNSFKWDDVGYNFLVGGDGNVYEGRGWDNQGAHTKGYNVDSIGISFIGTFSYLKPTGKQLLAAKLLIAEGVRLKKLVPDYRLYAHRQLSGTDSPGSVLFGIIQTWSNFAKDV